MCRLPESWKEHRNGSNLFLHPYRIGLFPRDTITEDFSKFNLGKSPTEVPVPIKIKVKTRATCAHEVVEDAPVLQIVPEPTIAISKRAYKVFSALFYNPMKDSPPGEIPWSEFLHALSSIGFTLEKQYGSAWLFTPPDTHQRTIIFHEPHPSRSIPINIVRRLWAGLELQRAYNWTSETLRPRSIVEECFHD